LAVSAAARIPALRDVPTFAELGHAGVAVRDWQGLVAPAQTPPEVLARIVAALDKVLATTAVTERLAAVGLEVAPTSGPQAFEALVRTESARWSEVVKKAGIRAD
jgi:tripartite-type tricarboxylate transporter receptor subunit TctC